VSNAGDAQTRPEQKKTQPRSGAIKHLGNTPAPRRKGSNGSHPLKHVASEKGRRKKCEYTTMNLKPRKAYKKKRGERDKKTKRERKKRILVAPRGDGGERWGK